MKKNDSIQKLLLIELLLLVGWCSIVLAFGDYEEAGFYFWGGFSFGVFSFIAAGASLLKIQIRHNRNTTEINYIPVYYTVVYFVLSLILNTYFVFRVSGNLNVLLVTFNLLLLVVFFALRIYTRDYIERVEDSAKHISDKIAPITGITAQLASIINLAAEPEVKKQLLKLKESVDYSSNVSQQFTQDSQNLFLLQLNELQTMLTEHRDSSEILKKIQEAMTTWKTRNSVITTIK